VSAWSAAERVSTGMKAGVWVLGAARYLSPARTGGAGAPCLAGGGPHAKSAALAPASLVDAAKRLTAPATRKLTVCPHPALLPPCFLFSLQSLVYRPSFEPTDPSVAHGCWYILPLMLFRDDRADLGYELRTTPANRPHH